MDKTEKNIEIMRKLYFLNRQLFTYNYLLWSEANEKDSDEVLR